MIRRAVLPWAAMNRALRLFALANHLHGPTFRSLDELARKFRVSQRTVFRDLADLQEMHLPIVSEAGCGYRLPSEVVLPAMKLAPDELALVRVALAQPALARQRPLRATLKSLESKLSGLTAGLDDSPTALHLAGPDQTGERAAEAMPALEKAVEERRECAIHYLSLASGSDRWRAVRPYALFHRAGAWYLAAHCLEHGGPRLFRVDRVLGVRPGTSTFAVPPDFDLERLLAGAWGVSIGAREVEVALRFDAAVAPLMLNARHHPGEQVERRADGSVGYRVRLTSLDEIARWVLGFGGLAVVESPPELRERVTGLARGVLAAQEDAAPAVS